MALVNKTKGKKGKTEAQFEYPEINLDPEIWHTDPFPKGTPFDSLSAIGAGEAIGHCATYGKVHGSSPMLDELKKVFSLAEAQMPKSALVILKTLDKKYVLPGDLIEVLLMTSKTFWTALHWYLYAAYDPSAQVSYASETLTLMLEGEYPLTKPKGLEF